MNRGKILKPGKYVAVLFASSLLCLCLFGQRLTIAEDALDIKRDSDKTVYTIGATDERNNALDAKRDKEKNVYTIGSSKEKRNEEARKEERSWDMLMNMNIWQDNSGQGRSPQSQPSQPASGK